MRVLVIGATGATGRVVSDELLARGHQVVAFARQPEEVAARPGVTAIGGDALVQADVERALAGCDAVVVVLGIRENPLLVRLRGRAARTALDVRSRGTAAVVAAMHTTGVHRLVVQSTYGAAETRPRLSLAWKAVFALLLAPQIADTERQEELVRASGLDWTLVRPVGLTDDEDDVYVLRSLDGVAASMTVSRRSVAVVHADAVEGRYRGATVAVSACQDPAALPSGEERPAGGGTVAAR